MTTVIVRSQGSTRYAVETPYGGLTASEAPPAGEGAGPDAHSLLLSALAT